MKILTLKKNIIVFEAVLDFFGFVQTESDNEKLKIVEQVW